MQFASLGSGSEGNGWLVRVTDGAQTTSVLIDCGFGLKASRARMQALDIEPESLAAILVTHEHSDHIGGVFRLAAACKTPVYLTQGTLIAAQKAASRYKDVCCNLVRGDNQFEIGGLSINPVPVPHDARDPVQYVLNDGRNRLGVLTDLGHGTPHVIQAYSGLDALVLESNHDPVMLADNPRYPASLKRRIGGPYGHLSNQAAADLLSRLDRSRLKFVAAAHLSAHNNTPALARTALADAAQTTADDIQIADQAAGLSWVTLAAA